MDHWNVRNGTDPLRILGAESYLDGSTLEIAQSLTDMAPSEIRGGRWNWYVERPTRQLTPPALNARQIEMPKPATAKVKGKKRGRSADVEETQLGKKQKRRASEEEGNEPENKARGRPRLDTKDETAADRRRTQIRMAQRAYRNRKEATITTLEKQNEELRIKNEQMNSAFIALHDLAVSIGILHREPVFGQQLQSVTRRFLALSNGANDEGQDGDENIELVRRQPHLGIDVSQELAKATQEHATRVPVKAGQNQSSNEVTSTVWGYQVVGEAQSQLQSQIQPGRPASDVSSTTQNWLDQLPLPPHSEPSQRQVIARATERNACFPFDMYHVGDMPSQTNEENEEIELEEIRNVEIELSEHQGGGIPPNLRNASPLDILMGIDAGYSSYKASRYKLAAATGLIQAWNQPPFPYTSANHETTFARRLHRRIVEKGLALITSPNPNPNLYKRVFGLSLRLYSIEKLIEAFRGIFGQMPTETPNAWNLLFTNLGASDTRFPPTQQDIESSLMPRVRTGRSIGPLTTVIAGNSERHMVDHYRSKVPGFEGEFFDTYDVEAYLKGRGIKIPPNAEWIIVDLDNVDVSDVPPSDASVGNSTSPQTPCSMTSMPAGHGHEQHQFGATSKPPNSFLSTFMSIVPQAQDSGLNSWMAQHAAFMQSVGMGDGWSAGGSEATLNLPQWGTSSSERSGEEMGRIATVNVSRMLDHICAWGVCLGRAPGFRRQHVDSALRKIIQEAQAEA